METGLEIIDTYEGKKIASLNDKLCYLYSRILKRINFKIRINCK